MYAILSGCFKSCGFIANVSGIFRILQVTNEMFGLNPCVLVKYLIIRSMFLHR